jgi:hypothetical protein
MDEKDGEFKTEYFLVQRDGNNYYDPLNDPNWQKIQFEREYQVEDGEGMASEDHDSEDSNREDKSENEYPDEDEMFDNDDDPYGSEGNYNNDDSDGSGGSFYRRRKRNSADWSDGSEDSDKAKMYGMSKGHTKIKNSIIERMRGRNKDWAHQNQK